MNYKHDSTAKSGYVENGYWEDITSGDDNDFGVLATGFDGLHGGTIRGELQKQMTLDARRAAAVSRPSTERCKPRLSS